MPERTLPADHKCLVVEFIGTGDGWRCACGRAYKLVVGKGHIRWPDLDDRPLLIDGTDNGS